MKTHSEHDEQVALCRFLDLKRLRYFAVPNGGHRDKVTAKRMKDEGLKPGVPDLFIYLPDGRTMVVEMKARESGRTSSEQEDWLAFFSTRPLHVTAVCHGAKEAIQTIGGLL